MVVGGADIDALGADVDIACGGDIAAGLAVGAAGVDADAAFQAADLAFGLQGFFAFALAAVFNTAPKLLGVGDERAADDRRN